MTQRDAQGHCPFEAHHAFTRTCETAPRFARSTRRHLCSRAALQGADAVTAASCDPEHLAPGRRRSAANLRRELFFTHELNAGRSLPSTACKALEERSGSPPALARPRVVTDCASPPRPQATPLSPCSGPTADSAPAARYVPQHCIYSGSGCTGQANTGQANTNYCGAGNECHVQPVPKWLHPARFRRQPSCCTEQTPTALRVQTRARLTPTDAGTKGNLVGPAS